MIDFLTMNFDGNQLSYVSDNGNDDGFKSGDAANYTGYHYDRNGNLTFDPNKGLQITYNILNLPSDVGGEQRIYDAEGNLLRANGKDYVGGIVYEGGSIIEISHAEGRVVIADHVIRVPDGGDTSSHTGTGSGINPGDLVDGNSPIPPPTSEPTPTPPNTGSSSNWRYEYVFTDHLGNARVWVTDLNGDGKIEVPRDPFDENGQRKYTEAIQEQHYYPFGMAMKGPWTETVGRENEYQYNGIEKDLAHDHIYHATFRSLDASIGDGGRRILQRRVFMG